MDTNYFTQDPFYFRMLAKRERETKSLVTIVATTLCLLFVWASVTSVPQSAKGQSKVTPSKRLQVIQSVDGGVITSISVMEGQRVQEGDTLINIDTTRSASNLQEKIILEASLRLKELRLRAQLEKTSFKAPDEIANQFPDIVSQELKLLQTRLDELAAQTEVYQQQIMQRRGEWEEAKSRADAATATVKLLKKELFQLKPLVSSGAVSPVEVLRLEKQVAQADGDRLAALAQSQRSQAAISEAKNKLNEVVLRMENQARLELSEAKSKLAAVAQNKVELTDRVEQATIKAPIGGLVKRILYSTQGAVVPPGQPILEIVPDDETLIFETRIHPKDIGFIRPGQPADIRLSAYEFTSFGSVTGHVEDIAPDSIVDEFGETFYLVKVLTNYQALPSEVKLIPGMQAEVNIRIDDRTVLSYLFKPLERGLRDAFTER